MYKTLVVPAVLSLFPIQPVPATEATPPWKQVLILRPARDQGPPMAFDYDSRNALPPFEKEPALEGWRASSVMTLAPRSNGR